MNARNLEYTINTVVNAFNQLTQEGQIKSVFRESIGPFRRFRAEVLPQANGIRRELVVQVVVVPSLRVDEIQCDILVTREKGLERRQMTSFNVTDDQKKDEQNLMRKLRSMHELALEIKM